ncbi:ricin-type beta-trefoil lectin domain protein [Streptomyces sp. NPDC059695]|uniref:ricin-type beta-trefoil lectin domain protein n=1 Tax=Streptomyces sp. NPDC059695 TaxID=3346910 RepID=UPI0036A72B97
MASMPSVSSQKWVLRSDGTFRGSQSGLCLGVVGATRVNGSLIELQTCDARAGQRWSRD